MSERTETYDIAPHAHVSVTLPVGDIRFREGDPGVVSIQLSGSKEALDAIEVDATPDAVTVSSQTKRRRWFGGSNVDAVVNLPRSCDVTVGLGAGDVFVALPVRDLEVNTGAGDLRVDDVTGTADVKIGTGDLRAGDLGGTAKISCAAGDVRVDTAHEITVATAAGDLQLGEVDESARIKSATGDIRIRRFAGTDLEIKTMSGDVSIGLVPGMVVNAAVKTMSGDFRNRIKPSPGERVGTMNLTVTSFAGDVTLRSAK